MASTSVLRVGQSGARVRLTGIVMASLLSLIASTSLRAEPWEAVFRHGEQPIDQRVAVNALAPFLAMEGARASADSAYQVVGKEALTVVPLDRFPDEKLFLYILHDSNDYVILRISEVSPGEPELRLWSSGPEEIVITPMMARVELGPSSSTFRLSEEAEKAAKLTPSEIISCIATSLGLQNLSSGNLLNRLSGAVCTETAIIELVLTVTNCFSIPSAGPALVFGTIGCVNGWAKLVACGVATCSASSCTAPITVGTTAIGSWTSGCTSQHRSGRYAKYYTFSLSSSSQVSISLVAATVDSYLYLLQGHGREGSVVASDDDGGFTGGDALITRVLSAGNYTIEATTYGSGATGSFSLRLTTQSGGGGGSAPVTWTITDGCSDSRGLRVRFFDRTNGGMYPSSGYYTVPSGGQSVLSFNAPRGARLCLGAATDPPNTLAWCYGINNDRDGSYSASCCGVVPSSGNFTVGNRLTCQ